jgi:type IV secretory pathway TraG/TraD family ATPase VirD4
MLCLAIISALLLQDSTGDSDYGLWWWVAAAGFVAYLVIVWRFGAGKTPKPEEEGLPPLSTVHGTAEFAPQKTTITRGLTDLGGVFFGKSSTPAMKDFSLSQNTGAPVCSVPQSHTLIVAQTQTGKGTRVIIPTLLRNLKSSFVVIDPKGENAAITARARSHTNHVWVINPWGMYTDVFDKLGFPSAKYNPLDLLQRDDPNVVAIAQAISATICPSEGKGKDSYWTATPARLLTAILLWLTHREGLATDGPPERKTLVRAREIASLPRKEFTEKYLKQMAASNKFGGAMRDNASPFIDLADDTYSGLISNLGTFTEFLSDPQVQAATASSDFSMTDLTGAGKENPTTVYLVTADSNETQTTWLRLLIWAATYTFKRKPRGANLRCMFLLDEFTNLGYLKEMPKDISLVAGLGIDFTLVIQGLDQLTTTYGDSDRAIIGNCKYKWFCGVADNDSAEYVSKYMGDATVRTTSQSKSEGQTMGPHGHEQEGKSTTSGETGRRLLMASEVLTLGRDVAILLVSGSKTAAEYIQPVDYWELPNAFAMFRDSCPKLFWDPPLQYDPNPNPNVIQTPRSGSAGPAGEGSTKKGYDFGLYAKNNPERKPYFDPDLHSSDPKPKPSQPPPQEQPEQKPPGSNYDVSYYSAERIAEREREAAKKAPPPAPKKPKSRDGDYDLDTGTFEPKKPAGGGDKQ